MDGMTEKGGPPPQRYSAKRKLRVVSRLLRGEPLELLARELNVTAARLSEWRDRALLAAEAALKERNSDDRDDEIVRLKGKVGEMTMETEVLREKIARLEAGAPLARRRSGPGAERSRPPSIASMAWRGSPAAGMFRGQPCIATGRHRLCPNAGLAPWVLATTPPCWSTSRRQSPRAVSPAKATARSGPVCAFPASAARPDGCAG